MLALFLFSTQILFAQLPDYHLQLFDHNAGIRPGNINKVAKDKKGFVWIGYPRQVQRFDGKKSEAFRIDGNIIGLFCDASGNVWVQTPEKIFRFHEASRSFHQVEVKTAKDNSLGSLFMLPDKQLYLVTRQGLFQYHHQQQTFLPATTLSVPPPYSTRVFAQNNWTIFFAHGKHIYAYNLQTHRVDSLLGRNSMMMFAVNDDNLMLSTWDGTSFHYNFGADTVLALPSPAKLRNEPDSFFSIRSMVPFAANRFFLASNTGIYEYNHQTKAFKKLKFFLDGRKVSTNDYVKHISVDDEGFTWMASVDGIARFSHKQQQPIGLIRIRQANDEMPLAIDNVRKILEDKDGNLWLATGHGFASWNKQKGDWEIFLSAHNREDRLSFPSIRGMVYDGRYLILGPANKGSWLFDVKTHQYRRPTYDSDSTKRRNYSDFIDDIITLRNGNHLLMGRDKLYLLNGKTYKMSMPDVPAAKENTNYGFQGSDGMIWITTQRGLHAHDSALRWLQNVELPGQGKFISSGFMMRDGRLLFSTTDGLFTAQYINGKAEVKKFTNLFDGLFVLTLYQDDNGIVWATSEEGIYRFDSRLSKLNLFDYSDNVQGYGFNGNSWYKDRNGYLFFGGVNGINYLKPENIETPDEQLRVYIQQVKLGKKNCFYTGFIILLNWIMRNGPWK